MAKFQGWSSVAAILRARAGEVSGLFNKGQVAALGAIADRLEKNGVILADEVGMGKTRVAVAVTRAVVEAGGRVAIAIPPGLDFQWREELKGGGLSDTPNAVRSMHGYLDGWPNDRPARPWFHEPVVVVSHGFGNWRLGGGGSTWRWELLPLLYAHWQKNKGDSRRYPRDSRMYDVGFWDVRVKHVAESIYKGILAKGNGPAPKAMARISRAVEHANIMRSEEYGRDTVLRHNLEQAVGLGLGVFDLIVVDEAHKSRGETSGLERLLENMLVASADARRFAITATPVELSVSQWKQILERIKAADIGDVSKVVELYAEALIKVRQVWQSDATVRDEFADAAAKFQMALSPYLLRRDKREDEAVQKFVAKSGLSYDSYRSEHEINIDTKSLDDDWKLAICAAEALSFAATVSDGAAKRLRLTMGNGHAISALLDQTLRDADKDRHQEKFDVMEDVPTPVPDVAAGTSVPSSPENKREQRAAWWQGVIEQAFSKGEASLYDHPAILAAVHEIERYTSAKEKVLVFGRFTRPLQAITSLLNARAMLRHLDTGEAWPQAKVHSDDLDAVAAAHKQLKCTWNLKSIDDRLADQYRQIENRRAQLRDNIFAWIAEGLGDANPLERSLADAAFRSAASDVRPLLARAIDELIDGMEAAGPRNCAEAFVDLVSALRDRSDEEDDADVLWPSLERSLRNEYTVQRGTFARLMYGGTPMAIRRTLQLAFNRDRSFPNVLVAQSTVGREGLNLHQACRVVVLLHPEWNPGVVEQQIGRVDRIGSRWSKELDQAIEENAELPRIEIRPVVFAGTYDDHNWAVLRARWSELRAQLHGVIVESRLRDYSASPEHVDWLETVAPSFAPRPVHGDCNKSMLSAS
ncbi:helicase-related protein [Rhizobium ruizarguesonis]|uniref:helicase-related protein n=1 Tax=Rhizobium ruizarguesonis TaxID=2081791 RepID=UPI001030879A|nr:helicase-related protein [Rhizobium ruizarguesonis]TAZ88152.1 type III restriction endonuclease subunit R [Rhizobium ruizarguesonis]TBA29466.1 type III restriction endonuclease subunit R [Rhizobium ruizarguesonis]TBA73886.1 type III restriction endonuclease subunit R [Rhizobium ruizarguesonis]TBC54104.1 type III restriction endonuclease subunit R [Rhizobium ruizarguesonis]